MIHKAESDPIIDEIHRTRERLAEKFGGDIQAILADARQRMAASGQPIWQGPTNEPKSLESEPSTPEKE